MDNVGEAVKRMVQGAMNAKEVMEEINNARNVRPGVIYDSIRHPATGVQPVSFFRIGIGGTPSAVNPTANAVKTLADTNLKQQGRLNSGERFFAFGMRARFIIRWVNYGATQANRMDDYFNLVKDVQQILSEAAPYIELKYGSDFTFYQIPLADLPYGAGFSPVPGQINMDTDMRWFGRGTPLILEDQTTIELNQTPGAPSTAFGSTLTVVQQMYLIGLMYKPLDADQSSQAQSANRFVQAVSAPPPRQAPSRVPSRRPVNAGRR